MCRAELLKIRRSQLTLRIHQSSRQVQCQSFIDVCHWLCRCLLHMRNTGKASGTQPSMNVRQSTRPLVEHNPRRRHGQH